MRWRLRRTAWASWSRRRWKTARGGSCWGSAGLATTDGGAGLLAALGAEPSDVLRGGGGALRGLDSLELEAARGRLDPSRSWSPVMWTIRCWACGARGGVRAAEGRLGRRRAAVGRRADAFRGVGRGARAGAGRGAADVGRAGGRGRRGLGYGLMLAGGRRVAGIGTVIEETGLAGLIAGADLVVTGEGKLDHSSLGGRCPVGWLRPLWRPGGRVWCWRGGSRWGGGSWLRRGSLRRTRWSSRLGLWRKPWGSRGASGGVG